MLRTTRACRRQSKPEYLFLASLLDLLIHTDERRVRAAASPILSLSFQIVSRFASRTRSKNDKSSRTRITYRHLTDTLPYQ